GLGHRCGLRRRAGLVELELGLGAPCHRLGRRFAFVVAIVAVLAEVVVQAVGKAGGFARTATAAASTATSTATAAGPFLARGCGVLVVRLGAAGIGRGIGRLDRRCRGRDHAGRHLGLGRDVRPGPGLLRNGAGDGRGHRLQRYLRLGLGRGFDGIGGLGLLCTGLLGLLLLRLRLSLGLRLAGLRLLPGLLLVARALGLARFLRLGRGLLAVAVATPGLAL